MGWEAVAPPKQKVGAGAGRGAEVWVPEPNAGTAEGPVVPPNENPDVPPPNTDWLGVPKVAVEVVAAPKLKGVAEAPDPLAPKANGLGAAGGVAENVEGPSKEGFPNGNPG